MAKAETLNEEDKMTTITEQKDIQKKKLLRARMYEELNIAMFLFTFVFALVVLVKLL